MLIDQNERINQLKEELALDEATFQKKLIQKLKSEVNQAKKVAKNETEKERHRLIL